VGPQFSASAAAVRARGALLSGDHEAAWELAVAGLDVGRESSGMHRYSGELLYLAMRAAVERGDPDRHGWVLAELASCASDGRGTSIEWEAWAAMARADATRLGNGRAGVGDRPTLQAAHDAAVRLGHRPMAGVAAQRLGEVLLTEGATDEAAAVLLPAMEEAEAAGALMGDVLRGVARRGRLVEGAGDLDLTPRELEVLLLVAEGRTNREVGEQLFITDKTASTHVSNLLRKLGLTNRGEAAAFAHRKGLVRT